MVIGKLEVLELDRIERIDPARPPVRPILHPGKLPPLFLEGCPGRRHQDEAIERPLPDRHVIDPTDLRHHPVGGKPRIGADIDQKADIGLRIDPRPRACLDQPRRLGGMEPIAALVAEGAVRRNALYDAERLDRQADRNLVAGAPVEAEGAITVRVCRQMFGKELRQDAPDPVGNSLRLFIADRAVIEDFGQIVRPRLGDRPEEQEEQRKSADDDQDENGEKPFPEDAPHACLPSAMFCSSRRMRRRQKSVAMPTDPSRKTPAR